MPPGEQIAEACRRARPSVPAMLRITCLLVVVMFAAAACAQDEPTASTGQPTTQPTPATSPATTNPPAPTTTLPPPEVVAEILDAPQGLTEAVAAFYAYVLDPGHPPPPLPPGLASSFTEPVGPRALHLEGESATRTILEQTVAVVQLDEDVVLAHEARAGWEVVGAKLARYGLPAWYGEPPRLLMIIGSDARPGQNPLLFRADSLHILGIDPARNQGSILGIPRDTLVTKLDGTQDKLTHAMASQGPEVLTRTAESLTGLTFDGYVVTGFKGFIDVVNAFGGFTFDIPFGITDEKAEADFRRGRQHLNGAEALAWSRIRHIRGGDFQRQLNQGEILIAMLTEAGRGGVVPLDVPSMLEIFTAFVTTDLTPPELLTLAVAVVDLDPGRIDNRVAPGTTGRAVGRSVVFLEDAAFDMFDDISDGVLDGAYESFP